MEKNHVQVATDTFSCQGCGGKLVFDPATQHLKCPYCNSIVELKKELVTPAEYEIEKAPTEKQTDWGAQVRVFACKSCGSQTVLEENSTSAFCAFCGNPVVLQDQSEAGIAPESVIPFSIPKEAAAAAFSGWLKKKFFAPNKAKKSCSLDRLQGVYLPHWTYDTHTDSDYEGQEGHAYYVTVDVQVQKDGKTVTEQRQERRIDWRPTSGHVAQAFDDVMVAGSERLPDHLLSRVLPYDLQRLCKYQGAYLAGLAGEKPVRDVKAGFEMAKKIIDGEMTRLAQKDILTRADEAKVSTLTSTHKNVKYKLVLLPLWLSSYKYKEKLYHVLVNGQNGKMGGEAPVSALKVALAAALVIALIALIFYFLQGNAAAYIA